jgi:hypothetical protein
VIGSLIGLAGLLVAPASAEETPARATDSCFDCHIALEHPSAQKFVDDIHHLRGLTCAACHGGDPTAEDMGEAMSPAKGFLGIPQRTDIPRLCARCHSDAAFMRAYNPSLRTDQLSQYRTSVHGRRLGQGDTRVAVCSDCHGIHDIRPASSPLSRVHPLQIPQTCARCHSDAAHMKPYAVRTDQLARYQASVHNQALEGGDLSAPTCATCHGNHGAAPPGVASVERVCGTCHVFQEQLFDQSPHRKPWEALGIPACSTCHSNHRIERTHDGLVGTGEQSFCVTCHIDGDPGWKTAAEIHTTVTGLDATLRQASSILNRAERAGMEVGEGRLLESSAQEKLIKARVEVHAFSSQRVEKVVAEGLESAKQAHAAGRQALAELAVRRKGLALSLLAIAFVCLSLWLLIRHLERPTSPAKSPNQT